MWDAPNQQVVRPDESGPWDEGDGGTIHPAPKTEAASAGSSPLDAMSKDELLDYARARGISPANAAMSKQDIRDSIDAAER